MRENEEPEDEVSIPITKWVVVAVLVFMAMFIVYYIMSEISSASGKGSMTRYTRAIEIVQMHEFYPRGIDATNRWGINENMTIKDARTEYFKYEGYARPLALQFIDYVCDGNR